MTAHWTDNAKCWTHEDPDLWYPATYIDRPANTQLCDARAECLACPVRRACLTDAMASEQGKTKEARHGVRAGTTPAQRYQLDKSTRQPKCGTVAGFRGHTASRTQPCSACQTAEDQRIERLKAASTEGRCGTPSGYKRHITLREKTCNACKAAHTEHRRLERHTAPAA